MRYFLVVPVLALGCFAQTPAPKSKQVPLSKLYADAVTRADELAVDKHALELTVQQRDATIADLTKTNQGLETRLQHIHFDWPNLLLGLMLGAIADYLIHAGYNRHKESAKGRALRRKYGKLARTYSNIRDSGTPTTGSVQLTQNRDGSFHVVGRHANGSVDWESTLWMEEKYDNLGTGYYRHKDTVGYGVQTVCYIPELDLLRVKGVRQSGGPPLEFFYTWRPVPQ